MSEKWLLVGLVGRTHGLRGGFIVAQRDMPIQIPSSVNATELKTIKIGSELTKAKSYQLLQHHNHGDRTILFCKELESPEQVKIVQGSRIWLPRSLIVEENAPEILWGDLIGRKILDANEQLCSEVLAIHNYGASDIVEIKCDPKAILLPLTAQYFDLDFGETAKPLKMLITLKDAQEYFT
ncbi:MAG: hypothetical protein KBD78_09170 [Oligoflexales bacterium]|nr:hypothetical protein [Oligoflexales bacterium]